MMNDKNSSLAKQVFWSEHSFYEKRSRRRKMGGKNKEKTDDYSGHYVIASSRPAVRRPLERRMLVSIGTNANCNILNWKDAT